MGCGVQMPSLPAFFARLVCPLALACVACGPPPKHRPDPETVPLRGPERPPQPVETGPVKATGKSIEIDVGQTISVSMTGVKEYSVGLSSIAYCVTSSDGKLLLVTGKSPGSTTLLLLRFTGKQDTTEIVVHPGRQVK